MTWALVTGATAGIGRAFVDHLAAQGHDIVLVARDAARLREVADQTSARFAVRTQVLVADLSDREAVDAVARRLASETERVEVLVNNAGYTPNQEFVTGDPAREQAALDVMVRAVMILSQAAAASMIARGAGLIINVSSVAGWLPGSTYAAAKGWVRLFTEGLALELSGTDVSAMALCPGYTRTEFHDRAGMDMRALPSFAWMDADQVVAAALRDARRGRVVSVPGTLNRTGRVVLALLPASAKRRIALRRPGSAR